MMNASLRMTIATVLSVALLTGASIAAAAPTAPSPLAPADAAQVTVGHRPLSVYDQLIA